MSLIEAVLKHYNLLLPRPHNAPLVFLQKVPSTLTHRSPILLPHLLRQEPTHPSTPPTFHTAVPLPSTGSIQLPPPSPPPIHPSSPTFDSVLGCRADKPQSASAVQNEDADFTVVDRKKKVSTERHERKQQAQRGTGENIDCRWAPPGITKLRVSLPKHGAAMTTISRRITKIISKRRLPEITIKRRHS